MLIGFRGFMVGFISISWVSTWFGRVRSIDWTISWLCRVHGWVYFDFLDLHMVGDGLVIGLGIPFDSFLVVNVSL